MRLVSALVVAASACGGEERPASPPVLAPHPDFPTPAAAGTEKLFVAEEPDRGPPVPLDYQPAREGLAFEDRAYCARQSLSVACSEQRRGDGPARWRIGRDSAGRIAIADRLTAGVVEETIAFEYGTGVVPERVLYLDRHGRVTSATQAVDGRPGTYTERRRNGQNMYTGCGYMAYELDRDGWISAARCLQWTGEPMHDVDGVAIRRYVRDARGRKRQERRFASDGSPTIARDGVHGIVTTRDALGRPALETYLGIAGTPAPSAQGCHARRIDYEAGSFAGGACLDADGRPTSASDGVASEAARIDKHGCWVSMRRHGPDGSPVTNREGIHGEDYEVGPHCTYLSRTCIGVSGAPMPCGPKRAARYAFAFDQWDRMISAKHFAADGSAASDPEAEVFEVRYEWDDLGNEISRSCHGLNGEALECGHSGFHELRRAYDQAGRAVEHRFFDPSGRPTANVETMIRRDRFDNYDHSIEIMNLDIRGRPRQSLGMATRRNLYDAFHRPFATLLYDAADRPARFTGCFGSLPCPGKPWHAVRVNRRPDGSAISNQFFDENGQLITIEYCSKVPCYR